MAKGDLIVFDNWSGGRNGGDPPASLPDSQVVEAVNVEWNRTNLGQKRNGATAIGVTTSAGVFRAGVRSLYRHVPAAAESAAELWAWTVLAADVSLDRLAGAATWAEVTVTDAVAAAATTDVNWASFNGKLFMCADTAVDRLHVWDGTSLRRVGLATPAAPTAADSATGGTYTRKRYYKIAYIKKSGSDILLRSELSPSVNITPDGAHNGIVVTKPAAISEGETDWELYGSRDDTTYHLLATTAIATATFADTVNPNLYTGNAPATFGLNIPPTSWKYIMAADNRILGAGGHESGAKQSRVWYTPVLGTLDVGDDERVPNGALLKNYIDLDEGDGGAITGMGGPLDGAIYVFKQRQTWKLIPTGNVQTPFRKVCISKAVGCAQHRTIKHAEDENGNTTLYFLSYRGPYRLGINGLEYMGRDIEDIWDSVSPTLLTTSSHAVVHFDKHQVWFWVSTAGTANNTILVFNMLRGASTGTGVRGGWAKYTGGKIPTGFCSALFSGTIGATMSLNLLPHTGISDAAVIYKCDDSTNDQDGTTSFQAYLTSKPYAFGDLGKQCGVGFTYTLAKALTGATITQTLSRDFGLETRTSTVSLTADASETRVLRKFENSEMSQAGTVQITIGDASALEQTWTLEALSIQPLVQQQR